jgi:hypothetical protein
LDPFASECASVATPLLQFSSLGAASLISRLESQLADSVPASEIGLLKKKHVEELKGLQTQAARAQELETELVKVREVESKLWLEFD